MIASNRFDDLAELLQKIKKEWLTRINSLRLKVIFYLFRNKRKIR